MKNKKIIVVFLSILVIGLVLYVNFLKISSTIPISNETKTILLPEPPIPILIEAEDNIRKVFSGNYSVGVVEVMKPKTNFVDFYECVDDNTGNFYIDTNFFHLKPLGESLNYPICTNTRFISKHSFFDIWYSDEGVRFVEFNVNENIIIHLPSMNYIGEWYKHEASKHSINLSLNIEHITLIETNEEPPSELEGDVDVGAYFNKVVKNRGINLSGYDIIIFIWYDNFAFEENGRARFRNTAGQYWEESNPENKQFQVYIDQSISGTGGFINLFRAILHEIGHLFPVGEGYIKWECKETHSIKKKACIMCGHCAFGDCSRGRNAGTTEELVVCEYTANKFGWINSE